MILDHSTRNSIQEIILLLEWLRETPPTNWGEGMGLTAPDVKTPPRGVSKNKPSPHLSGECEGLNGYAEMKRN